MNNLTSPYELQGNPSSADRSRQWIALALCAAVMASGVTELLVRNSPDYAGIFAPFLITLLAAGISAVGIMPFDFRPGWIRFQRVLLWTGLVLMVWTANGLLFDLLRITGLIPLPVDWPGMITRTLALAATIMIARLVLRMPTAPLSSNIPGWYGYAAFVLALPYPVLRTCWALGGTPGLMWPGAAGLGWTPWLACIPWLLAAILSLLLVSKRPRMPRRILLTAGWTATAIVGTIGPAACWSMITWFVKGGDPGPKGMAIWVPCLFYSSWLLWAIAAGAATRSFQLRTARPADVPAI